MTFQKATKKKSKLRLALCGVSGSGKTYSALNIGKHLGKRVAVIDTERGSASKYADDVAEFDVAELSTYEPAKYIKALSDAAAEGYDVVVIDSLSHGWMGVGGIMDQKDKKGGNGFDAWRTLTPQHNELVDSILKYPGHVIVTMRSKTEYVVEDVNGKKVPRKIGMAPVQRDGVEYEFDVVGDLDVDHTLHITKSRCSALENEHIRKPGEQVAKTLLAWLEQGSSEDNASMRAAAEAKKKAEEEAAAKAKADAEKAKAEADKLKAEEVARFLDAVDSLAEEIMLAPDSERLAELHDRIGDVAGNSARTRSMLLALSDKVSSKLSDVDWLPFDEAQRAAVMKTIQRVEERQLARKQQQQAA